MTPWRLSNWRHWPVFHARCIMFGVRIEPSIVLFVLTSLHVFSSQGTLICCNSLPVMKVQPVDSLTAFASKQKPNKQISPGALDRYVSQIKCPCTNMEMVGREMLGGGGGFLPFQALSVCYLFRKQLWNSHLRYLGQTFHVVFRKFRYNYMHFKPIIIILSMIHGYFSKSHTLWWYTKTKRLQMC